MMADRLFFYSGSADVAPGRGVHERVAETARYAALGARPGWRRMLSNFWCADFTLGGRTWRTVEHYFQATKIALADEAAAFRFALESGSALARGDGAEARKQRKLVVLSPTQLAVWDASKHEAMRAAMYAKFSQNRELGLLLLATGAAELWHSAGRAQGPQRVFDLESVRADLGANAATIFRGATRIVSAFNLRLFEALVTRGIDPEDLRWVIQTYLLLDAAGNVLTGLYLGGNRPEARPEGRREILSDEVWSSDLWGTDLRQLNVQTLSFLIGVEMEPAPMELVDVRLLREQVLHLTWRVRDVPRADGLEGTEYHEDLQWVPADAVPADVEYAELARLSSPDVLPIL